MSNETYINNTSPGVAHTLLFMLRKEHSAEDLGLAGSCLKSLQKSAYKNVVVYNQGFYTNSELQDYLSQYDLNWFIIGDASNVGIVRGRQRCFEYIWETMPEMGYISELHLDMLFSQDWELPLVELLQTTREPVMSCGFINKYGILAHLNKRLVEMPQNLEQMEQTLAQVRFDGIVTGFGHPCIHKAEILKAMGGYDTNFMTAKHFCEDDSLLLSYYYYLGTQLKWMPKMTYKSVVYHACEGQRLTVDVDGYENFNGIVKQYGAMGMKHLYEIHNGKKKFFLDKYNEMIAEANIHN
ncbi:MAG: hypothetical protein LBL96_06435 [Clostridiales bacterium]|jgi:hypothetical protein|nr:hypothetical protein [Clostridiales bacterium]